MCVYWQFLSYYIKVKAWILSEYYLNEKLLPLFKGECNYVEIDYHMKNYV